jgi:hypothetical protein
MPHSLAVMLEAASKFVVTLDQHPRGAVALVVMVVAGSAAAFVLKLT